MTNTNLKETKEEVVNKILENAEHRPWKVVSAIYGKLPLVYMRNRKLTHDQAMEMTHSIVKSLGTLSDDEDINKIRSMLITRIDIGQ